MTSTASSSTGCWLLFALVYLMPLFVMLVTSFKTMDEIQNGNMLALPQAPTFEPWLKAWGETCVGLTCAGIKGYFWNSIKMVVPAVLISTMLGALNGYVLTKWRFRGHKLVFGLMLFACFIPFQSVLLPMATILGSFGRFGKDAAERDRHRPSASAIRRSTSSSSTSSTASASPRCSSATTTRRFRPNWSRRRRSTARASSRSSAASCCRTRCRSSSSP